MADYVDWFENMFGADTSGNVDVGTGGDPGGYSGESYDAMFERVFGDVGSSPGFAPTYDTSAGGPAEQTSQGGLLAGAVTSGGGTSGGFLESALGEIKGWFDSAMGAAGKLFTEQPSTTSRINPLTGKPETVQSAGGGLNSLGQLLLTGAIQGLGQGSVVKWQQERAEKEKARDRKLTRETRDIEYARKEYGAAPQIGAPTRGVGLIKQTGSA